MSSLLSGIRFIPREKKEAGECDHGEKRNKKSKKSSKVSAEKDRKKKSNNERHESKEKNKKRKNALEYASKQMARGKDRDSSSESDDSLLLDSGQCPAEDRSGRSMQEIDFERFSNAIGGVEFCSSGDSADERNTWGNRVVRPTLRQDASAHQQAVARTLNEHSSPLREDKNQSVAAILRARLKTSKAGLQPTTSSTVPIVVVDTDPYSIAKRLLLVRKKGKEDELSSAAKKQRISLPNGSNMAAPSSLTQQDMFNMKADERWNEHSMDDVYVANVLRLGQNYKGAELGTTGMRTEGRTGFDEEDEIDMKMFQSSDDRFSLAERATRDQKRSEKEQVKFDGIVSRCPRCIESSRHDKQLTVSVGEHAYLRIKPSYLSFVPWGQCEIVPISHSSSVLRAGEETLIEIARYKSCLERMYERDGKSVVYLESAVRQKSAVIGKNKSGTGIASENTMPTDKSRHTIIDVIPIKIGDLKSIISYFREAFLQCDVEWSTHKKLIDLSGAGSVSSSLQKKVPAHMNYVSVEWPGGGYAHVVEDEELFNEDFCLDIMSGFFEDVPFHMKRRQHADSAQDNNHLASFKDSWSVFDWVAFVVDEAS